eukprot:scaffold89781_cov69-Phaeocystis_antarctica.AAC.7
MPPTPTPPRAAVPPPWRAAARAVRAARPAHRSSRRLGPPPPPPTPTPRHRPPGACGCRRHWARARRGSRRWVDDRRPPSH